jgi:hypothetical protein
VTNVINADLQQTFVFPYQLMQGDTEEHKPVFATLNLPTRRR